MVKDGVERLTEMQCADGGWGWFSGWGEHSDAHTTALVVHGLQIAKRNDVALVPGMLERGIDWLKRYQAEQVQLIKNAAINVEQASSLPSSERQAGSLPYKPNADNLDAFVYMVLAEASAKDADMLDFLYRDRTHLAVYGMAMYGLALDGQGEKKSSPWCCATSASTSNKTTRTRPPGCGCPRAFGGAGTAASTRPRPII